MSPDAQVQPRLRLGLMGFGAAAQQTLESLHRFGGFDPVGLADTDATTRETFARDWDVPVYEDAIELLDKRHPEAVYVATPTHLHEPMVLAALAHGAHVLVEKPIGTTTESCLRMIEAAEKAGLVLLENHNRSVDRSVITIWKLLKELDLGELKAAHRWNYSPWFYRPRDAAERDPAVGGIVLRQGSHEFDILRLLTQTPPTGVSGWTGDFDPTRPGEGAYQATIHFDSGIAAFSFYSGYDRFDTAELTSGLLPADAIAKTWRNTLAIPAGQAEGDLRRRKVARRGQGLGFNENQFGFTLLNSEFADLRPAPEGSAYVYAKDGRSQYRLDGPTGTDLIARELRQSILGEIAPLHDGRWGLAILDLCMGVRASAATGGQVVPLKHQFAVDDAKIAGVIGTRPIETIAP